MKITIELHTHDLSERERRTLRAIADAAEPAPRVDPGSVPTDTSALQTTEEPIDRGDFRAGGTSSDDEDDERERGWGFRYRLPEVPAPIVASSAAEMAAIVDQLATGPSIAELANGVAIVDDVAEG